MEIKIALEFNLERLVKEPFFKESFYCKELEGTIFYEDNSWWLGDEPLYITKPIKKLILKHYEKELIAKYEEWLSNILVSAYITDIIEITY